MMWDKIHKLGWMHIGYALGLILIGFFIAKWLSILIKRAGKMRFSRHQTMLMQRFVFYSLFFIFTITGLQELGFHMTALLGAAGVLTVALSFASQTAASNLVSGIFLIFEHPFRVGDSIAFQSVQGTVESIDLLSTKIRTADNLLVRIPNETIMKSEITNMSFFETRRVDILMHVAYKSDWAQVKTLLLKLANENPSVLTNPPVQVSIDHFSDVTIAVKLMAWANATNSSNIKEELQEAIVRHFDQVAIEMPFSKIAYCIHS